MPPTIKTAMIGFGVSGRCFHAPFLHISPKYELASVVERHGEESKKQYPYIRLCRTADEVMDDPDIDLIVITTPNESHFPLAQQALLAGKHVVLEKPFTIHSGDALQLIALAGSRRRVISPYQNRRYVSDYRTVCEIVRGKLLGDIVECEIHYDRYRPELRPGAWREKDIPGSGILYDLGAHLIDQALH
ncbi:MAG TPA: Gfo/Idh/MocA family oxidoreductase, partial [Chitinophagaceae bacterium]